jgi:sugar phosphate isomerase/epimerase
MFTSLMPGGIGVRPKDIVDSIQMAKRHDFAAVEMSPAQILSHGINAVLDSLNEHGVKASAWGVPFDWRGDEAVWRQGLAELPALAEAAAAVGATRVITWILPFSNDLELAENRAFHVARLKPVAEILHAHGCSFGLEFIGPKTLRDMGKYPFLYRSGEMLEMGKEMGSNVGLLVDCWHWYTAGESAADLEKLSPADVVYVHVNDAPMGIERDAQQDGTRCLPGETGVIDIQTFLGSLRKIGYDGPVAAEPFKKELNDLPDDDARLKAVRESLRKIGI